MDQDQLATHAIRFRRYLNEETLETQNKRRMLNLLELIDLSVVTDIICAFRIHLHVVGMDNFRALHRELREKLGIIPVYEYKPASGESVHEYVVPRIDPKRPVLAIDIYPDKTKCKLVQVGQRVQPVYKVVCN